MWLLYSVYCRVTTDTWDPTQLLHTVQQTDGILGGVHRHGTGPPRTVTPKDVEVWEPTSGGELSQEELRRLVIPERVCPGLGP